MYGGSNHCVMRNDLSSNANDAKWVNERKSVSLDEKSAKVYKSSYW